MTTQLTLIETTDTYTPPLVIARANLARAQEAFKKAEKILEDQGAEALGIYEDAGEALFHAEKHVEKWERALCQSYGKMCLKCGARIDPGIATVCCEDCRSVFRTPAPGARI